MIMIRIASVVALVTFWLAAVVWPVLIVAAPASAAPSSLGMSNHNTTEPLGGIDNPNVLSNVDSDPSAAGHEIIPTSSGNGPA